MNEHQFVRLSEKTKHFKTKFSENFQSFGKCNFENSLLYGGMVIDSNLYNSMTNNFPYVVNSTLVNSYVGSLAKVVGSKHGLSRFTGSSVSTNSMGADIWMYDFSILENAKAYHVILKDSAVIKGGSVVGTRAKRIELGGSTTIDRGKWTVAPLNYTTPSGISITENVGNLVTVGCITNTCEKFLGGAGKRYAKIVGSSDEVDFIRTAVKEIYDWQEWCRVNGIENNNMEKK